MLSEFLVRGISFFLTPVYTRLVDTAQFGQLHIYESWLSIFALVMSLGIGKGVERAKYDYEEDFPAYVSSTLFLSFLSIGGISILLVIFYPILSVFLEMTRFMYFTMLLYIPMNTALGYFKCREQQYFRYKSVIAVTMLTIVPATVGSVLLLYWGNRTGRQSQLVELRILGYYYPTIAVGLLLAILLLRTGRKLIRPSYWKYELSYSLPLIPESLAVLVMNQSDKFMIQKMIGDEKLGLFSLATTVAYIVWIIRSAVWNAFQPWFYAKLKNEEAGDIERYWLLLSTGFGLLAVLLTLITPEITLFFGGNGYREAVYLIAPSLINAIFVFYGYVYRASQSYRLKTKYVALATVMAMVVNVILNYFGIKWFGYQAAAYTTAISYWFLMIFQAVLEKRVTGERIVSLQKMILLSVIVTVAALSMMVLFPLSWIIRWGICVLVVVCAILAFERNWKSFKTGKELPEKN